MAVNFNLLKQAGPANFYEGLVQGQEEQRVNALAQQKMAQDQEINALRVQQVRGEIGQQERKVKAETAAQKTAMFRDRLLRASNPNSVRELVKMQYADPDVGALLSQTGSLEQALAEVPDDPVQFERYRQQEALGMTEWMKSQLPKTVGGSIYKPAEDKFFTPPPAPVAPPAPPVSVAEFERAKTDPAFMKFLQDRAAAMRPPAAPRPEPAPAITSIVNPVNPNEMITIDARRYQGGGAGSPGVIGVAGKEPGAALRQNKTEAGKTQLADDLANLRASFDALDKMRAIPSTKRNALSNVASGIAATGIGQRTGQLFGTEAQVERDVISSARMRLVNSIKNATGMSAQQLNSNVELQTMLRSISDPGQSVQAALRIIDDIEDAYVKGDGKLPKRKPPPADAGVDTSNPLLQVSP
jgi:hypothetical protein